VLAKIDRVAFGLLGPVDLAALDPRTPLSRCVIDVIALVVALRVPGVGNEGMHRRLMAVPFVGKDVPSRSSEVHRCVSARALFAAEQCTQFAHPDALIGLTVLAYRYEGAWCVRCDRARSCRCGAYTGLRRSDVKRVVQQLKHDFSRQVSARSCVRTLTKRVCRVRLALAISVPHR
jgi:hypothetical protein